MSRHYGALGLASMNVETLLAVDPIHWRTYERVVESE